MKLIVGLGNPGKNYINTRHNCGFRAIDFYANENSLIFKNKFNGEYCEKVINGEKVILLKPQTFMNLSGECIIKYFNYYNLDIKDVLIIYDDVDFDVGKFKIKRAGRDNGHNGIKDVIKYLKSEDIYRLKIGISKNKNIPRMEYVVGKFSDEDNDKLKEVFKITSKIIEDFSTMTIDELMQKYNGNTNE